MTTSESGSGSEPGSITRDFTVATFVVHEGRVLLLRHKRLDMWLPPGGHIEPNELPDEAAVREVLEEAGIHVELVGERALPIEEPRQLMLPRGIQLENISPGHQHIDLVYFARPVGGSVDIRLNDESTRIGWFDRAGLDELDLTDEIRMWTNRVLSELGGSL